jgi:Ca-activated chloride channel homolog
MRLLRPEFLRWWEVLPVLVACWAIHYHYVRSVRRFAAVAPRFALLSRRSSRAREVAVLGAGLLVAGALVFAVLRPQALLTQQVPEYERQDLIILLDRSASMRAHDIQPSRFSRAILEIRNFLKHKPEAIDRVGLVGFADASIILSYLTGDVDSIEFYLDFIDHDPQTLLGTNIGGALKSALDVLKKDNRPTRKLFLIVSDGEDYGNELDMELARFRADNLRVHCIGVGSEDEVPVPVLLPDGQEGVLRDEAGRIVKTQFAEGTLHQIAATTGGRYIRSTTGEELAPAIEDIVRGERKIVAWKTTRDYRDLYPAGLATAGAVAAVLWLLL